MTRTWWVKRLFSAPNRPARRSRPTARPSLLVLEDRTAPAALTEAEAGKTLVITLNEAGEALTIASAGATYSFTTTGTKFTNGGVSAPADFTGIDTQNLTLQASGLTRYDTVRVLDTAAGAKVTFADSGANKYADQFDVTLDNTSAGIAFNLASDYDTKAAQLVTDATLTVSPSATVRGSGGLTFRAKAIDIDTSATPGTVNAGGGTVTLTTTAGNAIDLGGADAAGTLGLTDAELDRVTAGLLRVGDAAAGPISVTGQITPAGTATLALTSGGAISNSAADKGVQVANLALRGGSVDLGTSTFNDATTLAGTSTAAGGGFKFQDSAGALTIGTVGSETGISTTNGGIDVRAGNVTVSSPVAAGAADITLLVSGIVNQSGISNSGGHRISLQAQDQDLQAGSTITAANGLVDLAPVFAGTGVDLGSAAAGVNFTDAELNTITAANLRIFSFAGLNLSDSITLSAAKVPTLQLFATDAITQAAAKVLTVSNLRAEGKSVALDAAAHNIATVVGSASAGDFAFKSGNATGLTVGGVTATGQVTIRSVNNLTVAAVVQAGTTIALTVADGNPAGRTANVPGSKLTAPGGTTITGGAGSDTFNVSASANSTIAVTGGLPSAPASPGDTLSIDAQGNPATVSYQGADLTKGSVQVAALKAITFQGVETVTVVNSPAAQTVVDGLAGNDVLVLTKAGGAVVFTFNGSAPVPVAGTKFTFNGLAGDDRMLVDFSGGDPALAGGVIFNGGNNTDTLQVKANFLDGSYRPSGADSGTVTVGTQKIAFATAERVDATGAATFAVVFPGADDTLTVANGKDFGSNSIDALVVSSPAAAFAPVALWNNGTAAIDTADAGGADGNDAVTITSANNAHANLSLSVRTGAGTDTVTIGGAVNVTGLFIVDTVAANVNANVTAGGFVQLVHTGLLQLGAVTVSGASIVFEGGGGAVRLTGDATAQSASGGVAFSGAIDAAASGGQSLTVTGAATVILVGSVGQTTRLKSLDVTGASINLAGAAYRTQLGQTYTGPVTVVNAAVLFDAAAGAVTFTGALDGLSAGASAVTVAAGGVATFGGPVGGTKALASLTATAASIAVNGGLVRTTGDQTYNSPVTVGQGTTFESTGGGAITFIDTLSGPFAVAVNTTGTVTFTKAVTVGSLTTSAGGTTQVKGGLVQSSGDQIYNDAVTVTVKTDFVSTGGGAVAFNATLDGGFDVTVKTAGTTTFGDAAVDAVGGATPLASLTTDLGGTTVVGGGQVKTAGDQKYNDAVAVSAAAVLFRSSAGAITFADTLNGTADGVSNVTVEAAGAVTFAKFVGKSLSLATSKPLASLTVSGAAIAVNGGNVVTRGKQDYTGPVTVGEITIFDAGGAVAFNGTLTSAFDVTILAGGPISFAQAVNVNSLKAGITFVGSPPPGFYAAPVLVNGGSIKTKADQTFDADVVVGKDTTFESTANGTVRFLGQLNGGFAVTINTAGATNFFGPVGNNIPLAFLSTNAGGTTQVNGGLVRTTGGQTFGDPVGVGANASFASIGWTVLFNATLDGPGGAVVAAAGTTLFAGAVGGTTPLAFLSTDAGGATQVNGGLVRTAGGQTYDDAVTVGANTVFATTAGGGVAFASTLVGVGLNVTVNAAGQTAFGSPVFVGTLTTDAGGTTALNTTNVNTGGALTFNDAVLLQAPGGGVTVLTSPGNGDVTFASTVDGPGGLAVVTGGTTKFAGPVGGTTALASLTSGFGGLTVIGGGLVRTVAGQGYGDAVALTAGTTFTASTLVLFHQTLSGAFGVVTNSPQVAFQKAVDVGQLTVNAAAGAFPGVTVNGPTVVATFGQSYALPVTVTDAVSFISPAGDVAFGQGLGGGFGVAVFTPGATTFGGPVSLASLFTDAGGTTFVRGGAVTTSDGQLYRDAVVVADRNTTFTSTGVGNVVFESTLSGGVGAAVNTAGISRFDGQVNLAALSTDAGGSTVINTGLVQTLGEQSFGDAVGVGAPITFRAGGNALFGSSLIGLVPVTVESPATTYFGGLVDLDALLTDAKGQTGIDGGSVTTTGGQFYGDPVGVGADTTFASTSGAGVAFGQTLAGPGRLVTVNTVGATVFGGAVRVGALVTNFGGTTAVNGGSVVTDGSQSFNDAVTAGAATTVTAGGEVRFGQKLTGSVDVVVASPGTTTFDGQVSLASLATDAAGATIVNTNLVQTSGGQEYGDAVTANVAATFSGAVLTFRSTLTSGTSVALVVSGDTTFFAPVAVGSLTTDAGGHTIIRGGSVTAAAGQTYGDDVVLGAKTQLETTVGDLTFIGQLNAEAAGAQGLTAVAPAGTLRFVGAVGSVQPIEFLIADARLIQLENVFTAARDVALTARGGGVTQSAGALTAATLGLFGPGIFALNLLDNDIIETFRANVTGPIQLADRNDLTVGAEGIVSGGGAVTIRTGSGFTALDASGGGKFSSPLVNVGGAEFRVQPGHINGAVVTLNAEIVAARAVFGVAGETGPNAQRDQFFIRPSANTPIQVNGNAPTKKEPGDTLTPDLSGVTVTGFRFDGQDGEYTFSDRKLLEFTGIEGLVDLALTGFVVQTGEPRDARDTTQVDYAVRIVQTQRGVPLPGGLDGQALLQNPFVVSPAFVNPAAPNAAPRLAFGDVNKDGRVDVILANGPGTSPLVTVIDGKVALNREAGAPLPNLSQLQGTDAIVAQFFAYDPRFFGGVNVAVADLNGDGHAEIITGADIGGGPHVRVFDGATVKGNADPREMDGFFAYEPTFTGGVRVAAGDVNKDGRPDVVLGAGVGGGPRVTVLSGDLVAVRQGGAPRFGATRGVNPAAELANFFAYDAAFRGGIFVDAGDFDADGVADILTGPGDGGPHVRVFDGETALTGNPVVLANFFAFDFLTRQPVDPLFGVDKLNNGVGGVAFTGLGNNGLRNVVVGSARGTEVEVVEYEFKANQAEPTRDATVLEPDGRFVVQNVSIDEPPPAIIPLPLELGYGATVGGFLAATSKPSTSA